MDTYIGWHLAPKIAFIETDKNLALILEYNIVASGFVAERCAAGFNAADALVEAAPDFIILNRNLPGLSGLELLRRLRTSRITHTTPVFIISSTEYAHDKAAATELGLAGWYSIPFSVNALMADIMDAHRQAMAAEDRNPTTINAHADRRA